MATLRDIGLSDYQARVYRALLRTGPTTAKELSTASDVPMGRIYDVLNVLERNGLIRTQNASRPQKYVAVEPAVALDRLLKEKRKEYNAELQRYEETVSELTDKLDATGTTEEPFWTVAIGPNDTIELLTERLQVAIDQIIMVATTPSPQFDLGTDTAKIVDELEAALERGVDVSILCTPSLVDAFPDHIRRHYEARLLEKPGFALRLDENLAGSFNLIDRTEVCIEVPNPLTPNEAFALIDLSDPQFAANVYDEFRPRWEQATTYP